MSLSTSLIWETQKKAYASLGIESWAVGNVPFHMTNNARIAAQYAEIAIHAFQNRPFTVLELGGGPGKFAFLFLQALARRGVSNMRYILTDAAEKNVSFWQGHPLLKSWEEKGVLKTALLDPLVQESPPADLVIANYFFDSIPHDLYSSHSVLENPYPDLPEAFQVLEEIQPPFLFPIGALRAIRNCSLILAGDREVCSENLEPTFHGKSFFSYPVNFQAIARFVEMRGGEAILNRSETAPITVALLSQEPIIARECFEKMQFGPLRFKAENFSEILECLEESFWDPTLFFFFFDRLEGKRPELVQGMKRVKEQFFPLFPEEVLLLHRLGLLFQSMGEEDEAADCFQRAGELESSPKNKPSFIREIEERFSLDTKVYSDADIDAFFTSLPGEDKTRLLQFFVDLQKRKNITAKQLEAAVRRLGGLI